MERLHDSPEPPDPSPASTGGDEEARLWRDARAASAASRFRDLEAEPVLRRLVTIQERVFGPNHMVLGLTLDLLAAAVSRAHPERLSEVKKLENRAAQLRLKRR